MSARATQYESLQRPSSSQAVRPASSLAGFTGQFSQLTASEPNDTQTRSGTTEDYAARPAHREAWRSERGAARVVPRQDRLESQLSGWHIPRPRPTTAAPFVGKVAVVPSTRTGSQTEDFSRPRSAVTVRAREKEVYPNAQSVRDAAFELWLSRKRETSRGSQHLRRVSGTSAGRAQRHGSVERAPVKHELFDSSDRVRKAAYEDWLAKKMIDSRHRKEEKRKAEEEKKEKAERELQERTVSAQQSFSAWKEQKDKVLQERKASEKAKQEQKEKEKVQEEEEKQASSQSAFTAWKSGKDEIIGKEYSKRIAERRQKRRDAHEKATAKATSSDSAFQSW